MSTTTFNVLAAVRDLEAAGIEAEVEGRRRPEPVPRVHLDPSGT